MSAPVRAALQRLPVRLPATSVTRLAADIDLLGGERRRAVRARLALIAHVLDPARPADARGRTGALVAAVAGLLDPTDADRLWLAAAVIGGRMPSTPEVLAARRRARLDGPVAALADLVPRLQIEWPPPPGRRSPLAAAWPDVEVVTGQVLVDVQNTADTDFLTGIQRVTRETVRRWARDHEITLVSWTSGMTALKPLVGAARERALTGAPAEPTPAGRPVVTIPWRCTYLLPELSAEPPRARAVEAMLQFSSVRGAMIGFDCVPVTSAETVGEGMGGGFSSMLGAAAHLDRIAAISQAAAGEYGGWRSMLAGTGLPGPEVRAVSLPDEAVPVAAAAVDAAASTLAIASLPLVLVVGSHEPRKNHLAVLQAADLCWRQGLRFNLVFLGGNAWRSEDFAGRVRQLQGEGRPVQAVSGASDEVLAGSYALARFTVFPSLNEGFGLPVAESLAQGTPVVTSGYGSMAEIAAGGGVLTVDPRDDHDIAAAMARLLTDDDLHARLVDEARTRVPRTWDQYAAETWAFFVDEHPAGVGP